MWRERAGTVFECEKTPVTAARGMGGGLARKNTSFFTDPRGVAARAAAAPQS
jgi:hypothetical protein